MRFVDLEATEDVGDRFEDVSVRRGSDEEARRKRGEKRGGSEGEARRKRGGSALDVHGGLGM